mgnify:CR=1 FL=1
MKNLNFVDLRSALTTDRHRTMLVLEAHGVPPARLFQSRNSPFLPQWQVDTFIYVPRFKGILPAETVTMRDEAVL